MVTDRKWKVGDTVFFVPADSRLRAQARTVTITKVGRIWLQLSNHRRCDRFSLAVDNEGYGAVDQCYVSESAWQVERQTGLAWSALRNAVSGHRPREASLANIFRAAALLGISITTPTKEKEA